MKRLASALAMTAAQAVSAGTRQVPFLRRYGERVLISTEPRAAKALRALEATVVASAAAANLSEIEQFGLSRAASRSA